MRSKLTLRQRVRKAAFNTGLAWDRFRLRFLAPSHQSWGYLLGVENPEKATRHEVEARARYLRSLAGKTPEEIEAAVIKATYEARIEPQVRKVFQERQSETARAADIATKYRQHLKEKGKWTPDGPEESLK